MWLVLLPQQAATASEITAMGSDVRRVVTKVDVIEEEVGAAEKLHEKTNMRVETVEEAIQEHAKKIQQMKEDLAKMNAGVGPAERITRRRKTMENDAVEKERGQPTPSFIALNGWMDWDRKMETMMGSADARKLIDSTFQVCLHFEEL